MKVPENYVDLLERRIVAILSTIRPDGRPHAVPVWVDYHEDTFRVVFREGCQKHRNMETNPAVTLTIVDPSNQYRYVRIDGTVEQLTQEGAFDVLDDLSQRFWDIEEYPYDRDEPRVLAEIEPNQVSGRTIETPLGVE